jgi:hypothetical protein
MEEQPNRRVKCAICGFETHRDEVPALWAQKRFHELTSLFSKQIIKLLPFMFFMELVAAPAGRGPSARRRLGRRARSGLAPSEAGRETATPPRPARLRRTAQPGLQPPETAGSRKGA